KSWMGCESLLYFCGHWFGGSTPRVLHKNPALCDGYLPPKRLFLQHLLHPLTQRRYHIFFKPGIATQPDIVARAWMRQWKGLRQIIPPGFYRIRQRRRALRHMVSQCILADYQRQLQLGQIVQQRLTPVGRTFGRSEERRVGKEWRSRGARRS